MNQMKKPSLTRAQQKISAMHKYVKITQALLLSIIVYKQPERYYRRAYKFNGDSK